MPEAVSQKKDALKRQLKRLSKRSKFSQFAKIYFFIFL